MSIIVENQSAEYFSTTLASTARWRLVTSVNRTKNDHDLGKVPDKPVSWLGEKRKHMDIN